MRTLFLLVTAGFWMAVITIAAGGMAASPARDAKPEATAKRISLVTVARHSTEGDCWMAIDGAVYDLSAYLPDHPTKPSVILSWCGKEATEAYRTKTKGRPHSAEANQLLERYRIGVVGTP